MHKSQVARLVCGPLVTATGIVGAIVAERQQVGSLLPWAFVMVAGMIGHWVVIRLAPFPTLLLRWSPVALAVLTLTVTLVGVYGFRSCSDLPSVQRCVCHYVGAIQGPSWFRNETEMARHRAALLVTCASDPALDEVMRSLPILSP